LLVRVSDALSAMSQPVVLLDALEDEEDDEVVVVLPEPELQAERPRASFSLRHPLEHVDPTLMARAALGVAAAAAVLWVLKRLTRKRLDVSTAWLWRAPGDARAAPTGIALPLAGLTIAVLEKCASACHTAPSRERCACPLFPAARLTLLPPAWCGARHAPPPA